MKTVAMTLALVASLVVPARATDDSIYQLDTPLRDQTGATVRLDVFHGHPVIISMFYGTCPAACPMLVSRIKAIDAELDPATRRDVRILLVSFDPKRDTPKALAQLFKAHQLDASRWKFAAAPESKARDLAAVLGIRYRRLSDSGFEHNSRIILLAPSGAIAGNYDAFAVTPQEAAARLSGLATSQQGVQSASRLP